MIKITQNDFTERTGIDLVADLREDGITNDRQADALITRYEKYVYETASRMGFPIVDDKLNDLQREAIIDATINYGLSCQVGGDAKALGDKEKLAIYTEQIITTLRQAGLIRNGFKGRSVGYGRWF